MNEPAKKKKENHRARGQAESVLRAKYHDYCSARVAEKLLSMSPDEIFVLAEEAARATGGADELTYERAVQLATTTVSQSLSLPSFESWLDEYARHPERFEGDMMGLWESESEP